MPSLEPTPEQDAQVLFISCGGGDDDASTLKFPSTNLGAARENWKHSNALHKMLD